MLCLDVIDVINLHDSFWDHGGALPNNWAREGRLGHLKCSLLPLTTVILLKATEHLLFTYCVPSVNSKWHNSIYSDTKKPKVDQCFANDQEAQGKRPFSATAIHRFCSLIHEFVRKRLKFNVIVCIVFIEDTSTRQEETGKLQPWGIYGMFKQ